MYVTGEFETEYGGAIADHADCPSMSPDSRYICTLNSGHSGYHIAGVDLSTYLAMWNDNRSTDAKEDFFASIGL